MPDQSRRIVQLQSRLRTNLSGQLRQVLHHHAVIDTAQIDVRSEINGGSDRSHRAVAKTKLHTGRMHAAEYVPIWVSVHNGSCLRTPKTSVIETARPAPAAQAAGKTTTAAPINVAACNFAEQQGVASSIRAAPQAGIRIRLVCEKSLAARAA